MIVEQGQNLVDFTVHRSGDVTALFNNALVNDISITGHLQPGTELNVVMGDISVANYFAANGYVPATNDTRQADSEGIGYWIIGRNFIVS